MTRDEEHLRLLTIFHYVVAGLVAMISLIPIFHVVIGITLLVAAPEAKSGEPPPAFIGWVFIIIGTGCILLGETIAALIFAAGRCLAKRRHYTFCLVIACVECIWMPFGTALGVFTLIVLLRESVKPLFPGCESKSK